METARVVGYADPRMDTPSHRSPSGSPLARLLVLDRHELLRGLLRPALEALGPLSVQFVSSAAAWERALTDTQTYDVLVADWDAMEQGGLAMLHGLRQRRSLREAAILVLADEVTAEMQALRALYRVSVFLKRPVAVSDIVAAVRTALDHRVAPDRLELLLDRAWRLLDEGAAPKALLVYQWLRTLHPDSLPALYGAGTALGAVGEWEVGLRLLEEVVTRSPLFLEAWNRMSDLAEAEGDNRALLFAARAAELAPGAPEVLVRRARAAQRAGDLPLAESLLRQAFRSAPDLWLPAFELTELLLSQDRIYDAARVVDKLHPRQRGRIDLLNHLGVALRRRGHVQVARQTYALALAEAPDNPSLLYNAAVAHLAAGEHARAIEDLRDAVRRAPDFQAARALLDRVEAGQAPAPSELDGL